MRRPIGLLLVLLVTVGAGCQQADVEPDQAPIMAPDEETSPTDVAQVAEKMLRVSVADETSAWEPGTSGVPDIEVWIRGTGSWFPDTSFGGDLLEEAGPFPVGEPSEFFVYPLGRDEPELTVPVLVGEEVIGGSVRDMITLTVEDNRVTVTGSSIPDFEATFDY